MNGDKYGPQKPHPLFKISFKDVYERSMYKLHLIEQQPEVTSHTVVRNPII